MNFANPKLGACVHLELIRHLPPLQQEKHPSSHRLEWPPLPSEVSHSCAHTTNRATHFRTEEKATVVKGAIHAPLTISLSAQLKIWVGKPMTSKKVHVIIFYEQIYIIVNSHIITTKEFWGASLGKNDQVQEFPKWICHQRKEIQEIPHHTSI